MCVDLESIMLSEVSQRKTNTLCYLYVESKKKKKMNEHNRSRLTATENRLVVTSREREVGWGNIGKESKRDNLPFMK